MPQDHPSLVVHFSDYRDPTAPIHLRVDDPDRVFQARHRGVMIGKYLGKRFAFDEDPVSPTLLTAALFAGSAEDGRLIPIRMRTELENLGYRVSSCVMDGAPPPPFRIEDLALAKTIEGG